MLRAAIQLRLRARAILCLLRADGRDALRERHLELLGRTLVVVEPFDGAAGQAMADRLFDRLQVRFLIGRDERECLTFGFRARGASHAVDVILGHVRHVEVHHMLERFHVDAARHDVGRDEHADLAELEVAECLGALALAPVTVDLGIVDPGARQHVGEAVRAMLRAREADHVADRVRPQQRDQQVGLERAVHGEHGLHDLRGRPGDALGVDAHRLVQQRTREFDDRRRQRGAEE